MTTAVALVSALAAVAAALIGYAVHRTNKRAKSTEQRLAGYDRDAALAASEVSGWKTLLDSLKEQYQASWEEASKLREQLIAANKVALEMTIELRDTQLVAARVERLERELVAAHSRIAALEVELTAAREVAARVSLLTAEVRRLGGATS